MAKRARTTTKREPRKPVQVDASRCLKCGSTNRTHYHHRTETEHRGTFRGLECTHIVRRRTECTDCGQARIDIHGENRAPGAGPTESDDKPAESYRGPLH